MLMTVEHVVGRMNGLMLQLRTGTTPVENPRSVELEPLIRRVCAGKTATDGRGKNDNPRHSDGDRHG